MTISTTTSRWEGVGNGSTTVFPYDNKIFDATDLRVYLDGVLQTLTTHYTVSGAGSEGGGNVTFVTAPASAVSVVIVRAVANTQLIDYPATGAFPSVATENGLDRRAIISQQHAGTLARSIQYLESDASLPSGILPTLDSLKGRYLKFNASTGAPEVGVFDSGTTSRTVDTFAGDGATTAFTLSSGVGVAGTTLDVYVSGVHQAPSTYTAVSTALTFTEAPPVPPDGVTNNIVAIIAETVPIGETDAALVSYTFGGTGSVARTVKARLQDTPTPEDYGASTGAVDNAAALNLMLAATGDVYLGPGKTYHLKSALTRTGSLHMRGGGTLVWDSDATSSGLTVNLTTAEGYSDVCRITDVAVESARAGLGDAITVDATAQISGSLQQRVFPRAFFTRVQVRGDGVASAGGWLNGINLIGASNTEINSCYFVGYLVGSTYTSASAVKIDDGGNTAVLNIKDSSFYYWDKAIAPNGCEGVNVEGCQIVSAEYGIYSRNTNDPGVTGAPQLFVQNNHINVRQRAVDVLFMQGLNISDNYIWQLSSSIVTGTGVYLEDCDDFIVSRNHFTANVGSGQDYRAVLTVDSTDGMVTLNHAQDVTQGFWAGTGSDNVVFAGNTVNKDSISNPEPILYVNTSSDRVVFDNERFAAKNASIVGPAASSTLATVDLGRVHLGQKFLVSAVVEYAKAAGDGITSTVLLSGGGTGTVVFSSDDSELRASRHQFGSTTESHTVSGVMTVTVDGTKTLAVSFSTAGGDNTVAAGEAQLTAVNLGNSMRLG